MDKPIIIEQYADNGEFSHWHLIKEETGEVLWSSFPEETIAQGQKIISSNLPVIKSLPDSDEIRMKARELDEKDFAQWMYEIQNGDVL